MQIARKRARTRLRLGTVLILVNLAFLILPLSGAFFFRFYENELVRQTERELISQSAVIAALYKHELAKVIKNEAAYGIALPDYKSPTPDEQYDPIEPQLDMGKITILPRHDQRALMKIAPGKDEFATGKWIEKVLL